MDEVWTDPELKRRHDEWKSNYAKLHKEMDFAMKIFIESKKCKCKVHDGLIGNNGEVLVYPYKICGHWTKERDRVFGQRINESFDKILSNGFETFKRMGYFEKHTK